MLLPWGESSGLSGSEPCPTVIYAFEAWGSVIGNPREGNCCPSTGEGPITGARLEGKGEGILTKVEILGRQFPKYLLQLENIETTF